ncbi:Dynein heavy chain 5, axonemal [Clonorchis sinensis]|uniref:Dynein heavy chain 5, axonemal n=1 Tax=Clonorchis sinensis TaxID=79923 RepID=A0A8T1LZZ3_CLOSI|nr:Dynein heavy chain 5, axonemal [Clonorchis sinensis]
MLLMSLLLDEFQRPLVKLSMCKTSSPPYQLAHNCSASQGRGVSNALKYVFIHPTVRLVSYTSDDNVTLHNKFGPLHERICHLVSERFRISQELAQECMLSENCMESVNLFLNSREDDYALAVYSVTGNMKKSYTEVAYGTPSDAYGADSSLFFMKSRSSETLSRENFNKYVSCFMLQKDENNLKSLHFLISTLYLPLLIQQKSYLGELLPQHKRDFIIEVKDYVHALNCSVACLAEKVTLATCREINLGSARDHSRCLELSQNLSTLGIVEECASRWMQQISLELREVNLVREELDTDGPHTEIHFWKCRMTRLNSLIDQLKRPDVANVSKILKLAQSKTLEAWSDLEKQIQVAYKEARENSKFLQSVKKHCDPLYRCQIVSFQILDGFLYQDFGELQSITLIFNPLKTISLLVLKAEPF